MRRRYWDVQAAAMTRLGSPNLPRLYEQYGRPTLASAASDPALAEKITRKAEKLLQKQDGKGRPYRGLTLYVFLTGVAVGAMQVMFSTAGTDTVDEDGTHLPTMAIAACCQAAIDLGMLEAA
ncbi:hypothetical protein [Nonomuraea sp. NPDC005650]|uniref:hypothetical protein n=1 Tax=Nonomuraea sp. NPDC005650 TaxID=3157045 RepID=UPI0033B013CC